ncbi:MAG TPA: hypothetical protein VMA54_00170 [Steroidobacteraceae bacterium]|nr:hypothetical protein [Steroidobacteraceae bacterium]
MSWRARVAALYAGLFAFTALAWLATFLAFHGRPVLMGMAGLAYTLGLRHAVDADHIAAIDNATRKLMRAGQRPVSVGLYFSLRHSTVVLLAAAAVTWAASEMSSRLACRAIETRRLAVELGCVVERQLRHAGVLDHRHLRRQLGDLAGHVQVQGVRRDQSRFR